MSNHLLTTSCGWYFRMVVPSDLRQQIGKREIKKPLYAPDKKTAIKKARVLACEVEAQFESLRGVSMSWRRRPLIPGMTEILFDTASKSIYMTPEEFNQLTPAAQASFVDAYKPPANPPSAVIQPTTNKPSLTVSEVIQKYCKEKEIAKSWTSKSAGEIKASLDLLVTVLGDIQITDVDIDMAGEVFSTISTLPSNWRKKKEYRDKTIKQLVNIPVSDMLSIKTVNKTMDRISSLWAWAVKKEYVRKQFFDGLRQKDESQPDDDRALFQSHQLQQVFQS
ncbi:MAG: DUF6538 domain-containing protein, partial [Deltaproteobacteria bacterium]